MTIHTATLDITVEHTSGALASTPYWQAERMALHQAYDGMAGEVAEYEPNADTAWRYSVAGIAQVVIVGVVGAENDPGASPRSGRVDLLVSGGDEYLREGLTELVKTTLFQPVTVSTNGVYTVTAHTLNVGRHTVAVPTV